MNEKQEIKQKFEEGIRAFVSRNYSEATRCFSEVIDMAPDFTLAYISRGTAYNRMDKIDKAMADYNRALSLKPDYPRAYHLRALLYEKKGEDEKAMADLNRALELDPEYGAAYYSRAALHAKSGAEEQARDDISMVTMLTEQNISAFANENNIWRSHHLRLEAEGIADVMNR
ncbi:MAG: tetratricopeptide repeat protein [Desulfobacterales bacterium]